MSRILLTEEILHIQDAALVCIERTDAFVNFSTQLVELFDMREQLPADLFLIGLRELRKLRNGLFERSDHRRNLAYSHSRAPKISQPAGIVAPLAARPKQSRANPRVDAAMKLLLPGAPDPEQVTPRGALRSMQRYRLHLGFCPDNGGIMPGTIQSFFATIDPVSPPPQQP